MENMSVISRLKTHKITMPFYFTLLAMIGVIQFAFLSNLNAQLTQEAAVERLQKIHAKLHLIHGNLSEEYPEQLMTAMYLKRNARVLELGANVGRNSCVIASILSNPKHLVAVESSVQNAKLLKENRDANRLKFFIEASAISKVPLIQSEWKTIPSAVDVPGYTRVNIISFDAVQKKYSTKFDTLVVDCEGALYYILLDDPGMLKNIETVIIENDFDSLDHMQFVHDRFKENGLQLVYNQTGPWGPCLPYFYQVWQKPTISK